MPDYIYLLENRLSLDQQKALRQISEAAREAGMTVFLVGGAVRDLTSGSSVRDLDVAVQGNALKLKKPLEKAGAKLWGEHEPSRTLFFRFPVSVRVEISSTRREEYAKPGKPVFHWDSILEDLRRRDFTANAMALSLNERSYGLLMDPLNGVADIEARLLRLVSNYGFIEDPSRLLRATRLAARLAWELEERTKTRFQNAKEESVINSLSSYQIGYELEEIGHEEDGLRVLAAMEAEGWMQRLFPAWTIAKVDTAALEEMHRLITQLNVQGINPDASAVSLQLLTAKLHPKELAALKATFVRQGFVEEWDQLDSVAKEFAKHLTGKEAATPSATWKLFTSANPQAVLWLGMTSKSPAVQGKYKNFFTVWPEARQKIPYALMQELRITPEIPGFNDMLNQLFFGIIDGQLETEEQLRAFLEPYSPPAPPPPVTVRRTRGSRRGAEAKIKEIAEEEGEEVEEIELDLDVDDEAGDEEAEELTEEEPVLPKKSVSEPKKNKAEGHAEASVKSSGGEKSAGAKTETPAIQHPAPAESSKAVHKVAHAPAHAKPATVHTAGKSAKTAPHHPAKAHSHATTNHKPAAANHKPAPANHKAAPAKPHGAKAAAGSHSKSNAVKKSHHARPTPQHAAKAHKKAAPAKKSHPAKKAKPAKKH